MGGNDRFVDRDGTHEDFGQSRLDVLVEKELRDRRLAQIRVDEQRAESLLREGRCEIGTGECLPLARDSAGDEKDPVLVASRNHGQRGPHRAEGFRHRAATVTHRWKIHPRTTRDRAAALDQRNRGNHAQPRPLFDLLDVAQRGIEIVEREREGHT